MNIPRKQAKTKKELKIQEINRNLRLLANSDFDWLTSILHHFFAAIEESKSG